MLSTDMTSGIGSIGKDNLTGKLSSSVETQGQVGKGPKGNIASIMGMDLINNLGNIGQDSLRGLPVQPQMTKVKNHREKRQ